MRALGALKGLLWFITVYQFSVGTLLLLSPRFAQFVVEWYGADVDWSAQFAFILKPLGSYMLMTGLIAAGAARAPVPHPSIIFALAVLFAINALYRIVQFGYVQATFGIAGWHLVGQIIVLLGLSASLILLQRAAAHAAGARAPSAPPPLGA